MRNLVFKNITSQDRTRRKIITAEIADREGVRSVIRRHFVYMVKEMQRDPGDVQPAPCVYIVKERNTREQKERFFCKIKGSVFVVKGGRLFLVNFIHSLKICLAAMPLESQDLA